MNKKLTAKTQELNPKLPQYSSSFGQTMTIQPESQELLLKKGTVYIVFDISGEASFDTELITKVVRDIFHDIYFQSESISPIQSMEKALIEVRNKVTHLSSDTLTNTSQAVNLNICASVLWGNVLYTISYGNCSVLTMKEGVVSPMDMISEGNFSAASLVVNEEDILIICTEAFKEQFPPEKLLSLSISEGQLQPNQACLLMRLIIDISLSENEEIDFGLEEAFAKNKSRERTEKITSFARSNVEKAIGFLKRKGIDSKQISNKIRSVAKDSRTKRITENKNKWSKGIVVACSCFILVFIIYQLKKKEPAQTPIENTMREDVEEQVLEISEDNQEQLDERQKVERINPEIFYDIKIQDELANPTEIVSLDDTLVCVDKTAGKIYESNIESPSFKTATQVFQGIKSIAKTDGLLAFVDNEGYKTYNVENSKLEESYSAKNIDLAFPYANSIYTITGNALTKNTGKDGVLDGEIWGQHPDFANAKSMAINFEIYILTSDNKLESFSAGEKTDFTTSDMDQGFTDTVDLVVDFDLNHIYVADKGNRSVVVLNEDGSLLKQFKHQDNNAWDDIKSITVSSDESMLFVLSGTKIFQIPLEFE